MGEASEECEAPADKSHTVPPVLLDSKRMGLLGIVCPTFKGCESSSYGTQGAIFDDPQEGALRDMACGLKIFSNFKKHTVLVYSYIYTVRVPWHMLAAVPRPLTQVSQPP